MKNSEKTWDSGMPRIVALVVWVGVISGHAMFGRGELEARWSSEDSLVVERIHDRVLGQGDCVEDLRVLCKEVGARLSGSPEADAAILWGRRRSGRRVHRMCDAACGGAALGAG